MVNNTEKWSNMVKNGKNKWQNGQKSKECNKSKKKGKNDKNYRPNILSNFPSQEKMDGFTFFISDPVPAPEEGVGV